MNEQLHHDAAQTWRQQIGEAAGLVWRALDGHGAMTMQDLEKVTGLTRDRVHQALGWLARERKVGCRRSRKGETNVVLE